MTQIHKFAYRAGGVGAHGFPQVEAVPVFLAADALAYGLDTGPALVIEIVFGGIFFVGIPGWMLFASLADDWGAPIHPQRTAARFS